MDQEQLWLQAYHRQKKNAASRGIEWQFTYATWVEWWDTELGEDWFALRGCKRNQYVMARKHDKGPYHPDNVECIMTQENVTRYNVNRVQPTIWRRPLDEPTVIAIFQDKRKYREIADEFGVPKNTVHRIKTKVAFAKITNALDEKKAEKITTKKISILPDELCPCCYGRLVG